MTKIDEVKGSCQMTGVGIAKMLALAVAIAAGGSGSAAEGMRETAVVGRVSEIADGDRLEVVATNADGKAEVVDRLRFVRNLGHILDAPIGGVYLPEDAKKRDALLKAVKPEIIDEVPTFQTATAPQLWKCERAVILEKGTLKAKGFFGRLEAVSVAEGNDGLSAQLFWGGWGLTSGGYKGYNARRMVKVSNSTAMPFSVARSVGRSLVDQVVDGVKRAIETGRYAVGDIIPSTRDMAEALGVSRIVTRAAVRELADAGYVNPRQGVGCVVLGQKGKLWKGTVLFVAPSDKGDYYTHVFSDEMSGVFVRNGWRFIRVAATRTDTSLLELELAHPVDLAIVMFGNPPAEKILSKSGVPFVAIGDKKAARLKGCIAAIPFVREAAAAEVAVRAKASGVKSAWQVGFEPQPDLIKAFAAAKISLKEILVKPAKDARQPEATAFAAQAYFEKLLAKDASDLPDLLYFSDDYVCQGALLALVRHGIEAPRDVKVVTWSNRGNGPYYFKPLARVELAPQEDGRRLAENLLCWLSTHGPLEMDSIATVYFKGDTA